MGRKHAFAVAVLFSIAAVGGAYATMQTVDLGASAADVPVVADSAVAKREKKLDQWEQALKQAARKHTPKLPKIPKFNPVAIPEVPPLDLGSVGPAALPQPPSPPNKGTPKPAAPKKPQSGASGAEAPQSGASGAEAPQTGSSEPPPAGTIQVNPDPVVTYVQGDAAGTSEPTAETELEDEGRGP